MMKKNLLMLSASAGQHGLDRGGPANFRGVEARAVVYGANGYASYCNVRGYHYGTYPAAAAAAAYADGRSDSSSERGCYYASKYGRYSYRPSWSATKTD